MGISNEEYLMIKRSKEIQELFENAYSAAMIYGNVFIRYSSDGSMELVDPNKYDELIDALKWDMKNRINLGENK
jgi:hypothetical protein